VGVRQQPCNELHYFVTWFKFFFPFFDFVFKINKIKIKSISLMPDGMPMIDVAFVKGGFRFNR